MMSQFEYPDFHMNFWVFKKWTYQFSEVCRRMIKFLKNHRVFSRKFWRRFRQKIRNVYRAAKFESALRIHILHLSMKKFVHSHRDIHGPYEHEIKNKSVPLDVFSPACYILGHQIAFEKLLGKNCLSIK